MEFGRSSERLTLLADQFELTLEDLEAEHAHAACVVAGDVPPEVPRHPAASPGASPAPPGGHPSRAGGGRLHRLRGHHVRAGRGSNRSAGVCAGPLLDRAPRPPQARLPTLRRDLPSAGTFVAGPAWLCRTGAAGARAARGASTRVLKLRYPASCDKITI